jgi:hypothetical protein
MRRRTIVAVALLAILVLFVGGLVIYSARALSRFERVEARRSTLLYAAPPILLQSSYARPEGEAGAPAGSLTWIIHERTVSVAPTAGDGP